MKKVLFIFVLLSLLVVPFLATGTSGTTGEEIRTLRIPEIVNGIRFAMSGNPQTMIMQHGDFYMFIWPNNLDWNFVTLTAKQSTQLIDEFLPGRCIDCSKMTDLIGRLASMGWKTITPDEVPMVIKAVIVGQTFANAVATLAEKALVTVWVLPIAPNQFAPFEKAEIVS